MTAAAPPILPEAPQAPPVDLSLPKVRHAMILFPRNGSPDTSIEVREGLENVIVLFETKTITSKQITSDPAGSAHPVRLPQPDRRRGSLTGLRNGHRGGRQAR